MTPLPQLPPSLPPSPQIPVLLASAQDGDLQFLVQALPAAAYGAVLGLLLPRVVHRLAVPPLDSWRADCPNGHRLTGPCGGWLGRARCDGCAGGSYGPGALPLSVAAALACGGLAAAVGVRPELVVWLLAAPVALLLAAVDRAVNRLPDVLTLPLAAGTALLLGAAALLPGAAGSWWRALQGGAVLGVIYLVLHLINRRGMGLGDVKLAVTVGLALGWYGWAVLIAGAFLGFLLMGFYGVALILMGRAGRRTAVPFGPFMVLGSLAGVLIGALTV